MDTFLLAGERRSAKQQKLRYNLRNRNGRLCAAAPVLARQPKCVGVPTNCANDATNRLCSLGWNDLSLPPAAPLNRWQLTLRGQRLCWFPGNESCSEWKTEHCSR